MDRVPFKSGNQRRDAARTIKEGQPTSKVDATTLKVEAALTSRDEAAKLRRRLLEMIVENEKKRHSPPSTSNV